MTFSDLSKRLILSLLSLGIMLGVLALAYLPFVNIFIFAIVAAIASMALWEYGKLVKLDERRGGLFLLVGLGLLLVSGFSLFSQYPQWNFLPLSFLALSGVIVILAHFNRIEGAATSIGKMFFGLFYITVPLGLFLLILYPHFSQPVNGRVYFFYLIAVTKITDIGAYFGGRLCGRKKLAPKLSPQKTVEGAIIGLFSAVVLSVAFYLVGLKIPHFDLTFVQSLVLGVLFGSLGQIGDLSESLFKRGAEAKDSSRLPGFGGFLDLFDSLLFTTPILYLFLYIHMR